MVCFAFHLICKIMECLLLRDVISASDTGSSLVGPPRHWSSFAIICAAVKCKSQGLGAALCLEKLKLTRQPRLVNPCN